VAQHAAAQSFGGVMTGEDGADEAVAGPPRGASPVPVTRSAPRAGRNDPCPCGSGKKYKKCHMLIDEGVEAGP
jgi:preprotein translocase subunit SecA